ncbi:MAG: NAD(P)H-binding protein [Prolixibacteraceae bacterium]|nr:NAD(P)H-binding protein [Prolixibacteraceae bacterium]
MKIAIFGASGKTGVLLVSQALEQGFEVNAYVRRENALTIQHPNLKIILGNLHDEAKIKEVVRGVQAYISTLGSNSLTKHSIEFTMGIKKIVQIAVEEKINQFIYMSSIGAGESRYYMAQPIRFLIAGIFLRIPLADHTQNENTIRSSPLNWTIIRPGGLSNGKRKDTLTHGSDKITLKGNPQISRASVASFILKQVNNETYSKKAVWLYEQ